MIDRAERTSELPDGAAQRVLAPIQLRATAWAIVEAFVRERHPGWSSGEVAQATRERFLESIR